MTKYELINKTLESSFNLVISRRKEIRKRINVIAGFGLSIMTLLATSLLKDIEKESLFSNCFLTVLLILSMISFIAFVTMYIKSYGIKEISEFNPLYVSTKYPSLINYDLTVQETYLSQLEFYESHNIVDAVLLAETDALYNFHNQVIGAQINKLNEENYKLNKSTKIMNIFLILTIFLLILMRGVI